MNKALNKIAERLKGFRDQLTKADLKTKKIPEISDSADIDDNKKMIESKHMNGKNVEQYNHKGEKIIHDRAKNVCDLNKSDQGLGDKEREDMKGQPKMIAPPEPTSKEEDTPDMEEPKGLDGKKKPVTHDECGRPFGKDDIDKKIQDKIRAKMNEKNFGEADATKHIIDRDIGAKQSKPKPLMQSEQNEKLIKFNDHGQWSLEKSNYGPKGMDLYSQKDNIKRKENNTGESLADIGKNKNTKQYTTPGSSMQAAGEKVTAKEQKIKTKASTKIFSDDEKKALEEKYRKEGKI